MIKHQYMLPAIIDDLRLRGHFFTAAFLLLPLLTAAANIQSLALSILTVIIFQVITAFCFFYLSRTMHLQLNNMHFAFGSGKGLIFAALMNNNRTNNTATEWVIGSWLYAGFASMSTLAGEVTNPQVVL